MRGRVRQITLPAEARSVAAARAFVTEVLASVAHADPDPVVLMASELVANVVLHARTDVGLSVDLGPPVRVEVHDGLAATDAFRELISARPPFAEDDAIGGRGLGLVHDLATRIGLDDDPDGGKVVWFEYG